MISTKEHQNILNLLNEGLDFKFLTRKWNTENNQSKESDGATIDDAKDFDMVMQMMKLLF